MMNGETFSDHTNQLSQLLRLKIQDALSASLKLQSDLAMQPNPDFTHEVVETDVQIDFRNKACIYKIIFSVDFNIKMLEQQYETLLQTIVSGIIEELRTRLPKDQFFKPRTARSQ